MCELYRVQIGRIGIETIVESIRFKIKTKQKHLKKRKQKNGNNYITVVNKLYLHSV